MRQELHDRMYARAVDIIEGRANGLGLPILRALSVRGYVPAQMYLSDMLIEGCDGARGVGRGRKLLEQAARRCTRASYNLAVEWRNRGSLGGYRRCLARAAAEDAEAGAELKRFETRFSEQVMRHWGRLRPDRPRA